MGRDGREKETRTNMRVRGKAERDGRRENDTVVSLVAQYDARGVRTERKGNKSKKSRSIEEGWGAGCELTT